MKIAVQGCCHGHIESIYDTLLELQEKEGVKIDLLLCCGDFQAVRNSEDLNCMAVPNKYKSIGSFYKYYSGEMVAPILTVFIGGNHEASNHLRELGYGGWVAPNIYYIGHAGVVNYGGIRIGGISGIYKHYDYYKGHYEKPPYTDDTLRTAYHVRACDVYRLKQFTGEIDIMMSHDWPLGIHRHGNYQQLFRYKPFFEENADNELGSPPAMELLQHLKPSYWFSAHLHCKFSAVYRHHDNNLLTKFLALDKPLPKKHFLQVIDIPTSSNDELSLQYDPEWLSILHYTEPHMIYVPGTWIEPQGKSFLNQIDSDSVSKNFNNDFKIPLNFEITTEPHSRDVTGVDFNTVAVNRENPQTRVLCEKLGIKNPWFEIPLVTVINPDEITLTDDDEDDHTSNVTWSISHEEESNNNESEKTTLPDIVLSQEDTVQEVRNPNEILIDIDDDDEND